MNTGNSVASLSHSYTVAEKAPKLLTGKAESLAPDPLALADAAHADDSPGDTLLDVVEYHE